MTDVALTLLAELMVKVPTRVTPPTPADKVMVPVPAASVKF